MLLTRQGISLTMLLRDHIIAGAGHFCRLLHVAMQVGLYLFQPGLDSGVQSLRILNASRIEPFLLIICTPDIVTVDHLEQ
jgi:hypothetical protein